MLLTHSIVRFKLFLNFQTTCLHFLKRKAILGKHNHLWTDHVKRTPPPPLIWVSQVNYYSLKTVNTWPIILLIVMFIYMIYTLHKLCYLIKDKYLPVIWKHMLEFLRQRFIKFYDRRVLLKAKWANMGKVILYSVLNGLNHEDSAIKC